MHEIPGVSTGQHVVAGAAQQGTEGVHHPAKAAGAGHTDTIQKIHSGGTPSPSATPDPGQPFLMEDTSGMTSAQMFGLIFGAIDTSNKQRAVSAMTTGPQFKQATQYSSSFQYVKTTVPGPQGAPPAQKVVLQQINSTTTTLVGDNTPVEIPSDAKSVHTHFFFPPSFVEGYQTKILHPNGETLLMPALSLLGTSGKIKSYDINNNTADTASAIAYAEHLQGVVHSGDIKDFSNIAIPHDHHAARQFAAVMEGQVLNTSVSQVGLSLGMHGLGHQASLQAQLARNAIAATANPDTILNGMDLQGVAAQLGITTDDLKTKITAAVNEFAGMPPVYTFDGMQASLRTALGKQFTDDNSINILVNAIENSAINSVVGQNVYHSIFDPSQIDVKTTISSLSNSLMKSWGDSIQQLAADNKAASLVHDILNQEIMGQYKSAQDVRDAISKQLQGLFPDMDAATADTIANGVNLGLPQTGPLYDPNSSVVMLPNDLKSNFRDQYQSRLGVSSDSAFGQALEHAAGISNPPTQTSYTGLMNQAHQVANRESRNYLDPGTSTGETTRQQRLYDPGYQLVMQWSPFMASAKLEHSASQTGLPS